MPAFGLLLRLFEEQCEVVEEKEQDGRGDEGEDGGSIERSGKNHVKVREPKTIASDSLQSPHDPDATYGHKGKGYEVQVSETCEEDNPYQVITGTSVNGAHESDQKAVSPMLDQLEASEMAPEELLADTGYGSGANIVECAERNVDLHAPVRDPDAPKPTDHFAAPVCEEAVAQANSEAGSVAPAIGEFVAQSPHCSEHEEQSRGDVAVQPPADPDAVAPIETAAAESERPVGLEEFSFDATFQRALSCPGDNDPKEQHMAGGQLYAVFSSVDCSICPLASGCPTRLLASGDRLLRRAPATIATEVRQYEQQQPAFKERYRKRSGVESTNQELKGRHGLRDLRVRGEPRVELGVRLKSLALNAKRAVQYHVSQMVSVDPCPCSP